jgi:hypothetical protein
MPARWRQAKSPVASSRQLQGLPLGRRQANWNPPKGRTRLIGIGRLFAPGVLGRQIVCILKKLHRAGAAIAHWGESYHFSDG